MALSHQKLGVLIRTIRKYKGFPLFSTAPCALAPANRATDFRYFHEITKDENILQNFDIKHDIGKKC